MEKLNIAEILKDCPKGMELNCMVYDDIYFDYIDENYDLINCYIKYNDKRTTIVFNAFGCFHPLDKAKCVIFPKGKTTWEGFQIPFKDGDAVATRSGAQIFIFKEKAKNEDGSCSGVCYFGYDIQEKRLFKESIWQFSRHATEEEKQKLFDAIKANGYKWNPETKTLEKLIKPKFKVGDEIVQRNSINNSWIVNSVSYEYYGLKLPNGSEGVGVLPISEQDDYELVSVVPKFKVGDRIKLKNTPTNNILTVTKTNDDGSLNVNMYSWVIKYELQDEYELVLNDQPKFKVGDKIKKKGDARLISVKDVRDNYYIITIPDYFDNCYITDKLSFSNQGDYELVPNKFNINNLKPFESRVLVRNEYSNIWKPAIYGFNEKDSNKTYVVGGNFYKYCIPYDENKHLLGTTNDCDGYYKTWE